MLQRVFKRAYRSGLALYECDPETLDEEVQYNCFVIVCLTIAV